MTRPVMTSRWLVRREVVREPRFGETRADVVKWVAREYVVLPDGSRQFGYPTYYGSAARAADHARDRCAILYRCRTPHTHDHPPRSTR